MKKTLVLLGILALFVNSATAKAECAACKQALSQRMQPQQVAATQGSFTQQRPQQFYYVTGAACPVQNAPQLVNPCPQQVVQPCPQQVLVPAQANANWANRQSLDMEIVPQVLHMAQCPTCVQPCDPCNPCETQPKQNVTGYAAPCACQEYQYSWWIKTNKLFDRYQ